MIHRCGCELPAEFIIPIDQLFISAVAPYNGSERHRRSLPSLINKGGVSARDPPHALNGRGRSRCF